MQFPEVATYRQIGGGEIKPKLSRREAAAYLTDNGFPIAAATLARMVSTGGGPGHEVFLGRALYDPQHLLDWARSRLSAPHDGREIA